MAELHVQPKRNNYWWLWVILIIIIIAAAYYYFNVYKKDNPVEPNSTTLIDSSNNQNEEQRDTSTLSLAGANLWNQVNFNSPDTTFSEVNDSHITLKSNAHFLIYSISSQYLFENNKSELTMEGKNSLKQVCASIKKRFDSGDVRVLDNTDSTTSKSMASERAKAVSSYLADSLQLGQSHVSVFQTGETMNLPDKSNTNYIVVKK